MTEQFNSLGSNQLGANAIFTAPTAQALYDNPLAIIRGAPSAPSVSPWAFARAPVTAGDTTMFKDPVTMGFVSVSNRSTGENVNLTGVYTPVYSVNLMNDGVVRVKWTQGRSSRAASSGPEAVIGRVRAGTYSVLSGTFTNSNNAAQESKSYDATIEPGDTIVWLIRPQTNGQEMQMYNFELATDGELLHPISAFFTFGSEPA